MMPDRDPRQEWATPEGQCYVLQGNSEQPLPFRNNTFDTVITDPPYGLKFMGKKWDYDVPSVSAFEEILRVAKPGSTLLCFAGSRTQHRMACNIEDAGWRLFDCIMWLYGTGFPKASDVSKQIDKTKGAEREVVGKHPSPATKIFSGEKLSRNVDITVPTTPEAIIWNGWKSHALKPAYEPIICAMKPNDGTNAENALKWGVAGLNIDGGRIESGDVTGWGGHPGDGYSGGLDSVSCPRPVNGRFPANIILGCACATDEHEPGCACAMLDAQSDGVSRFYYCSKASRSERDIGLEDLQHATPGQITGGRKPGSAGLDNPRAGAGRTSGGRNTHPTVKPLELIRYLCRLTTTPTGGLVLDPFCGSGTTGLAARMEGRDSVIIDRDPESIAIVRLRIATPLTAEFPRRESVGQLDMWKG